ncbi:hypothetical protein BaRGS_00010954 [Batillaria attramentaria]|uniref:Uncharacterized protein n=1 Tax=Batillaria attramentaria TaxID=370345 RepID=A0ABD0LEM4_9CAEN
MPSSQAWSLFVVMPSSQAWSLFVVMPSSQAWSLHVVPQLEAQHRVSAVLVPLFSLLVFLSGFQFSGVHLPGFSSSLSPGPVYSRKQSRERGCPLVDEKVTYSDERQGSWVERCERRT